MVGGCGLYCIESVLCMLEKSTEIIYDAFLPLFHGTGGWWRGDYGRKKKKWFPANYVEEIDTADPQAEAEKQLGNLQQGAIDIAGTL